MVVATRRIGKGATLAARTVVYGANGETNLLPTSEAQVRGGSNPPRMVPVHTTA